jgi:hypothetical protein
VTCIDLTTLPIINRKMVKSVALKDAASIAWKLQYARAYQKVYKDYVKNKFPGLTEHNGFSPPRTQAEAVRSSRATSWARSSNSRSRATRLPPVSKVIEKVKAKGKLNGPETLMAEAIFEVESFLSANPAKLHHDWLVGKEKMNGATVRGLAYQLSQIVFSIIVGQTWFSDCPTPDDNTVTHKTQHGDVVIAAELREIEIKL